MNRRPLLGISKFWRLSVAIVFVGSLAVGVGCSDDEVTSGNGGENGSSNQNNQGDPNQGGNGGENNNQSPSNQNNQGDPNQGSNNNNNTGPSCDNLECDLVDCPPGEGVTTLSGTVYGPSGDFPLPNATVYIPNSELEPVESGVSCQRCDEMVSGDPLAQTDTNALGEFTLENVPAGEEVPLVIQTGKWRRQIEVPVINACEDNTFDDPEVTRLPRNQDEGEIPRVAVATGQYDALQCLLYQIGLDEDEFSSDPNSDASITILKGTGNSATSEFSPGFSDGGEFVDIRSWWDNLANLEDKDIVMYSCDNVSPLASPYNQPPQEAREALQDFADQGGRVFLTDLQREFLESGTSDFQSVTGWSSQTLQGQLIAQIDTSFPEGQALREWLELVGGSDGTGQIELFEIWNNMGDLNTDLGQRWIFSGQGNHYIDFNTPVGSDEDSQCGRVVYSDLHVTAGGGSSSSASFPDGCSTDGLTGQEQALIYLFFDLSGCVVPECTPISCDEVEDQCGVHSDGCGGSIDCGNCDCRNVGESCTSNGECCTSACAIDSGSDEGICIPQ